MGAAGYQWRRLSRPRFQYVRCRPLTHQRSVPPRTRPIKRWAIPRPGDQAFRFHGVDRSQGDPERGGRAFGQQLLRSCRTATSAFSAPITLDVGCGVSRWSSNVDSDGRNASHSGVRFSGHQRRRSCRSLCKLRQVGLRGDGLGRATPTAPFSNAFIQLPGPAARSESELASSTIGPLPTGRVPHAAAGHGSPASQPIRSSEPMGFSDLNGDGIPIMSPLTRAAAGRWRSAPAWALRRPSRLSSTGRCSSSRSKKSVAFPTTRALAPAAGLYDFYGEGQPAFVALSGNALNIYSPSAGGVSRSARASSPGLIMAMAPPPPSPTARPRKMRTPTISCLLRKWW